MHQLSELAAFVAVVDSASLTATARRMSLSKSTLSRRLARLEARVGQPLLRRRSNRLEPTDAGWVFAGYCRDMLDIDRESRYALERAVAAETARFGVSKGPRPPHWSGFRLTPSRIEFWQDGKFRLHDRAQYTRDGEGWTYTRLYP